MEATMEATMEASMEASMVASMVASMEAWCKRRRLSAFEGARQLQNIDHKNVVWFCRISDQLRSNQAKGRGSTHLQTATC